jgi:DNA polymerase III subunit delta
MGRLSKIIRRVQASKSHKLSELAIFGGLNTRYKTLYGGTMKYTSIADFERDVTASPLEALAHLYLINTKDETEGFRLTEKLVKKMVGDNDSALMVRRFDMASGASIEAVIGELANIPFITPYTVVVVTHGENLNANQKKSLERYYENSNKDAYLIITAGMISATTTFFKKTEKNGVVLHVGEEKSWQKEKRVIDFVCSQVAEEGKNISHETSTYLVRLVGADTELLIQEIKKIVCYIGERRELSREDVEALCCKTSEETVWKLGEAILSGDARNAAIIARECGKEDGALYSIVGALRRQLQTGLHIASLMERGGSKDDVTQQFPYMRGRILDKNVLQAQRYGSSRFKKSLMSLNETDLLSKNSMIDGSVLLDVLVAKM